MYYKYRDVNFMDNIYKKVIQKSNIGYAYHEILCDINDIPYDYKCIEVNKVFEKYTGLKAEELLGRRIDILFPDILESGIDWLEYYGKIALDGENIEYEKYSKLSKQ